MGIIVEKWMNIVDKDFQSLALFHVRSMVRAVQGLTSWQLCYCPTMSKLSLAGCLQHVQYAINMWLNICTTGNFIHLLGDSESFHQSFRIEQIPQVSEWIACCEDVITEQIKQLARLDPHKIIIGLETMINPFQGCKEWTIGLVNYHVLAEIARHSGHMDIIRESIDGYVADFSELFHKNIVP